MDAADTELEPTSARHAARPRLRLGDAAALAVLALLVRLPAALADRHLTFDDGVFANSAIAMRDGGVPFRDVFSSQGPLFLPLVFLGDLLGLRTLDGPRVLAVASGIAAVLAITWAALAVTDRLGALLAGGLAAVSGGLAWVTGPLAADGPALAFAALAVGITLRHRDDPRTSTALGVGAAVGATLSTKSLEAPVLIPVALVLAAPVVSAWRGGRAAGPAARRGLAHGAVAVAGSVVVFLAVTLPLGFADVWDQSVRYRTDAAAERDVVGTTAKLFSTLWDRDLALLFVGAVALGWGVLTLRRTGAAREDAASRERDGDLAPGDASWWSRQRWSADPAAAWVPSGRLLATSWLVGTLVWLAVVVSPLWRPHVAAVALPLVLVIGIYRPTLRVTVAAAVLALPLVVIQLDGLLTPGPYRGVDAEIVAALGELPVDAWVISDEPGVVWRSGLRTTDDLVDPSMLRLEQGRYTESSIAADASDPRVCAVVVSSDQHFRRFDGLAERLVSDGFAPVATVGDGTVLYVREDSVPTS